MFVKTLRKTSELSERPEAPHTHSSNFRPFFKLPSVESIIRNFADKWVTRDLAVTPL